MSKIVFLLFVAGFLVQAPSDAAMAKGERSLRVDFDYVTNLNYRRHESLEILGRKVMLNGIEVPSIDVLRMQSALRVVLAGPRKADSRDTGLQDCASGRFVYVRKKAGASAFKREGCISSRQFAALQAAFALINGSSPALSPAVPQR